MTLKTTASPEGNNDVAVQIGDAKTVATNSDPSKISDAKLTENKRIKYRVEYVEAVTGNVLYQHESESLNFEVDADAASGAQPVFEIVTTVRAAQKSAEEFATLKKTPPVGRIATVSMHILSSAVIHALRSVVQYYPTQDLSSAVIKISAPYAILAHHYDELMEYREKFKSSDLKEICYREKDAYEHLGVLKAFLDEHVMPAVEAEKARNKRGYYTFDMYWVTLKPGTMFKDQWLDDDTHYAGVIHSVTGGSLERPTQEWTKWYWSLEYDGSLVERTLKSSFISKFDGESTLHFKPLDRQNLKGDEEVERLISYGKIYWNHMRKQCKYYKGATATFPHNDIDGLVMVDMDAYYEAFPGRRPDVMTNESDARTWVSDCMCPICNQKREADKQVKQTTLFEDFEGLPPKTLDELDDDQYLVLPSKIYSYVFRTRTWEHIHVKGLSEPQFEEDMIDQLVMDEKRVSTLKALAKSFIRINRFGEKSEREPWSADFVKGKGKGLTFLLHGSPGTGKTCTAECIAAFTSRPLMVLTSSDIGTFPTEVETNLTEHFKRARSWGAVLLIDEADVFMERRTAADLTRNSLVAGFLRALEFYDGILFLTTNRVGAFDDAFISRIHFQLRYPDFNDESRRKVWQTFIDKLQRERGDYIRLNIDAKEYLDGKELKAVEWNGREIRNAFQTAVALAEYEAVKDAEGKIVLTDKHLKSIVEMSRDFKSYLNDLHRGSEGKRAERRTERLEK